MSTSFSNSPSTLSNPMATPPNATPPLLNKTTSNATPPLSNKTTPNATSPLPNKKTPNATLPVSKAPPILEEKKKSVTEPKNEGPLAPNVLKEDVVRILKTCFDPEIPVNIYELGLIYEVQADENHFVNIRMTLTSPNCPAAESLPQEVTNKVKNLYGVSGVKVDIVWEPVWTKDMMSEAAQLQLGLL